jgi:hypothetical protein
MNNVTDSKKRSKSRDAQSASTIFHVGRQCHTYRQPTCVYRNWAYRPDRAAKQEFAAAKENN